MSKCTDLWGCVDDCLFNTDDAVVCGAEFALLVMCAFGLRGSARCRRGSLTAVSDLATGTYGVSGS